LTEFSPEKRYITLFFGLEVESPLEARVVEPEKCAEWRWVDEENLPFPLFEPVEGMLQVNRGVLPL
jgi:8-oxo-dGTP diphosphatase